ncbi:MAG: UDP-3-O-(3-hydroxymyristoyl)glucosamine N-acyltransferase [Dehalococcoidia bacterium]|nr:UDP-3-O-(3-hydroxymyristoyl)glucosamine N-acyltransferase [Dehalococcoidia bacterium]
MDYVRISDIAKYLGKYFSGSDGEIVDVCPINDIKSQMLTFVQKYKTRFLEDINNHGSILVIASSEYGGGQIKPTHILSDNPKLDFARAFAKFFPPVDREAVIGEGTVIEEGAVVRNTVIGKNCYIKSNAVIGQKGFSFANDVNGIPFPMPHRGGVVIGNNVEIGACTTVVRGVMSDTIIGNNVKIDDHVHVAHNVTIGENTMITACTEISGSVKIGKNVWIGPNCSILNQVEIGDGAFINISSTIVKDYKPIPKENR